jgi:hypothetical protein
MYIIPAGEADAFLALQPLFLRQASREVQWQSSLGSESVADFHKAMKPPFIDVDNSLVPGKTQTEYLWKMTRQFLSWVVRNNIHRIA